MGNKKFILLFAVLFSIHLSNCDRKKELSFSSNVFKINHSVLISEDELGDPWDLLVIDSVLVVANNKETPVIETYNLRGKLINKFLTLGQGPEEVISVGNLQSVNNKLFIYGLFEKKFLEYHYNTLFNINEVVSPDSVHVFNFTEKNDVLNKLHMGNNFLIAESTISNSRIILLDYEGNYLKQGGQYPDKGKIDERLTDFENARLYGSSIILSKDRNKIALATYRAGMLDIFDLSGSNVKKFWGFEDFLPQEITFVEMGEAYCQP